MSSRLASAPNRVNAPFATSKIRSRFRSASVRGFLRTGWECFFAMHKLFATGDSLLLSIDAETLSVLLVNAGTCQFGVRFQATRPNMYGRKSRCVYLLRVRLVSLVRLSSES